MMSSEKENNAVVVRAPDTRIAYPKLPREVTYSLPEDLPSFLKEGSFLWKVRAANKWYRRKYFLNLDAMQMIYDGSHKVACFTNPEFHIDISDIHDVRKGWMTDTFNKLGGRPGKYVDQNASKHPLADEGCCFSIIYGPKRKTLDLVAPNEDVCESWVAGLQQVIAINRSVSYKRGYEIWIRKQYKIADKDNTGALNFEECFNLLNQLNVSLSKKHAETLFKESNVNKKKVHGEDVLDEYEFVEFYRRLLDRPELSELMRRFGVHHTEMMGPRELHNFAVNEQKMQNITVDQCEALIKGYEAENVNYTGTCSLSIGGFRLFLLCEEQNIFNWDHKTVYQDMTRPLNEYYIASSHNTYLLGDQLTSQSSVEGYISALKSGCRSVELDIWDGPDQEPVVYHGYTLTSKILLKEILTDAIKPYAFEYSDYPLILSFENHCSVEQQKTAAKHLKSVLGDLLLDDQKHLDLTQLPSPESLKRKIIIKGKRLPDIQHENEFDSPNNSEEDELNETIEPKNYNINRTIHSPKIVPKNIAQEFSDLVIICQSVKFQSFRHSRMKGYWHNIVSLQEKKINKFIIDSPLDLIQLTQTKLLRIYPSGGRTNSSNYKPISMWNCGCQLVALNYQTSDKALLFNKAKFQQNGNCGYVLKPDILRKGNFHPHYLDDGPQLIITIKVISGQHIPKPGQNAAGEVVDPYVIIKVRGVDDDKQRVQTSAIENNGFNPVWNETFTLSINVKELAFLHFIVRDHSALGEDKKLGEYVLPVTSVQQGYRHVNLVDASGESLSPASLFVHISLEEN